MNNQNGERRRFQRFAFDARTELIQGGRSWQTTLYDVSLKGLLVRRPEDWEVDLTQPLQARVQLAADVKVVMTVELARADAELVGLVCRHIDVDSISHLRRLVELNLGDTALLERELAALGSDE